MIQSVTEAHRGGNHPCPTGGEKLAAGKGINLPDSQLRLPALTAKDVDDLAFIARHADLVGYSFVRQASDVYELQAAWQNSAGNTSASC